MFANLTLSLIKILFLFDTIKPALGVSYTFISLEYVNVSFPDLAISFTIYSPSFVKVKLGFSRFDVSPFPKSHS